MQVPVRSVGVCVLVAALAVIAAPASAQQVPKLGVTFGYDAMRVSNNPCEACGWNWYQLGFNVDAAVPVINNQWHAVGEFGWVRHPFREDQTRHVGGLNAISVGGGLRFTPSLTAAVQPFVQMLVGLHRDSFDGGKGAGLLSFTGPGIPANSFMVHPGVGVLIPVSDLWGVVGQVDYRRVFSDQKNNAVRVLAGIRLHR
jgi:hypothetical protein